jgi:MFS-type transporter involved in bile tolerance (Atg22 family)
MTPFILTQIPFGKIEDKRHNEKLFCFIGIIVTVIYTTLAAFINPSITSEQSFFLLIFFLFFARVGCSLIEISTESMFYKHVTERDSFALLMFRAARFIPYTLGLLAAFWV